ncbi:MAG: 8-hydroxy-5-deazaflavin:NADPH oxidoreductase [Gaiellaceae bacterium]|nr:8-hydroxy-5-deazaflavin:NADPH oxidoreductase [Gaiellaceae bacterium]
MRFGVLGTGVVGKTIASKLLELGEDVTMGARDAANANAAAWVTDAGERAHAGTFADAAAFGEIVVNATAGGGSLEALAAAGAEHLDGKLLIDISNPLDFSKGFPPTLSVANTDSLGEQIQAAHPEARVVKTLNTVNADVMVQPGLVPGRHAIFVCGNDAGAKAEVAQLLGRFGWPADAVVDLGDITSSRGTEMYLALWIRLYGPLGTGHFNIELRKGEG